MGISALGPEGQKRISGCLAALAESKKRERLHQPDTEIRTAV
jgi:hypothetical protein